MLARDAHRALNARTRRRALAHHNVSGEKTTAKCQTSSDCPGFSICLVATPFRKPTLAADAPRQGASEDARSRKESQRNRKSGAQNDQVQPPNQDISQGQTVVWILSLMA